MQLALTPRPVTAHIPRIALSIVALVLGFVAAAAIGGLGPFDGLHSEPSPATRTVRALPFDAPVPDAPHTIAGEGRELPYRLEWHSSTPPAQAADELAAVVPTRPRWTVTLVRQVGDVHETTLTRATSDGMMTHFARLTVTPDAAGSLIAFDFISMQDLRDRR
jgi:hypothetical protein